MNFQTQLSVELTNVFGGIIAVVPLKKLWDLGRNLRKSGSDIVVEEDLANIFGRGRTVQALESQFKTAIKDTRIVPLYPGCGISLQSGPGPTVTRAMRDQDRKYMSTVIQLSFLSAFLNRTELATGIVECMNKRLDEGVDDTSGPGFEDVIGVLEACCSQTSRFNWQPRIEAVNQKIRQHFSYHNQYSFLRASRSIMDLPINVLLAAMDYLYLTQSLPEDRKVFCKSEGGAVPLVVWAHVILGLTVLIRSPSHNDLIFGDASKGSSAQVIINWRPDSALLSKLDDAEVLLLDKGMKVVLKRAPDNAMTAEDIAEQERHNLQSYGSTVLRRHLNTTFVTSDDSPIYLDLIELILALAIISTRKIWRRRARNEDSLGSVDDDLDTRCYSIELWRISLVAEIFFNDHISSLDSRQAKQSMLRVEKLLECLQEISLADDVDRLPLPRSIEMHLERLEHKGNPRGDIRNTALALATQVILFSHVIEVKDCKELSLPMPPPLLLVEVNKRFFSTPGKIEVDSNTIFVSILRTLMDVKYRNGDDEDCFLMSDFGWSVFLDCIGDTDPAEVSSHLVHIKPGVPTNHRAERKNKIKDAQEIGGTITFVQVEDQGNETYNPRCEQRILHRTAYYASRNKEFWLSLRFDVRRNRPVTNKDDVLDDYTAYRQLHEALWEVDVLKGEKCFHSTKSLSIARLGLNVATFSGYSWHRAESHISERICVCLVKDDPRARWLAVRHFYDIPTRQVALRGPDCCEDCALDTISALPGEWILIL